MRIAFLTDLAPPYMGGGETYVLQLGKHLANAGHEVHWVTSKLPHTKEYERIHGIEIHRLPILFSRSFLFPGRQSLPLTAMLQRLEFLNRVDVVQANTLVAGYGSWRIARRYDKPSLLFCHEFFGGLWRVIGQNAFEKTVYPRIERRIARSPYDWFACPSEYSKSTLVTAGAPKEKITVVPHGIDHSIYRPEGQASDLKRRLHLENVKTFGFLGRLRVRKTAQSKNLARLLSATRIVVRRMPQAKLVLGGSGFEELQPLVDKMGLHAHVVYAGNPSLEENPAFLRMLDLVVCPALSDGFCFLIGEASACGRAVVASRRGAHLERVVDGVTGLLVEPTAGALAEAIVHLLSERDTSERFGQRGNELVKDLTWDESMKGHLRIYEQLCVARSGES